MTTPSQRPEPHTPVDIANYLGERRNLFLALVADLRNGYGVNEIAQMAAPALSRPVVQEHLACVRLKEAAVSVLAGAEIGEWLDVSYPEDGSRRPRKVLMQLGGFTEEHDIDETLLSRKAIKVLESAGILCESGTDDAAADLTADIPLILTHFRRE
ncbi:hypothetical protein [Glycomyces sp. MUSA5-2]|uniref:hypothetical protein n=1 Tax=Glycomyces sp. MUSA5-2 TaxID=2053002 RepID=UPI0030093B85